MNTFPVLVTGVFSSGKTEFIRSISEIKVVWTEQWTTREVFPVNPLPVLDFGRLTVDDDNVIYLFGTPATRRIEIEEYLQRFKRNFGIIFMVDSAKPETFHEAYALLQNQIIPSQLPCVVAANRQDHPDAWYVESVRNALKIHPAIPVVPCVAKKRDTVKPVLLALFELWSKWGDDEPDATDNVEVGS